jgi:2',3'-cyclic-nucleotide 2'-phosphodiesterase (5'-nucleotidase family)
VSGIRVRDVVETLERILPEVRRQSDFVIVTAHLTDEEERRVAKAFPEIRLIVGGHNHSTLGPIHINQTVVAKTGNVGRNVGRVDLEFVGTRLARIDARLIPVVLREPDREIAALLAPFQSAIAPRLSEVLGEATAALTKAENAESSLANLVADAYRARAGTEIGLTNVGGIRAPIARGAITWGSMFEVFPFRDTLVTLKLTGAQLKRTLGTRLLAVSGVRARYDLKKPVGSQLISVTLADGSAVSDTKIYTVAVNDFMVAGGDGFGELARATDIVDTHISILDVLTDYVKRRGAVTSTLDGRVSVE